MCINFEYERINQYFLIKPYANTEIIHLVLDLPCISRKSNVECGCLVIHSFGSQQCFGSAVYKCNVNPASIPNQEHAVPDQNHPFKKCVF